MACQSQRREEPPLQSKKSGVTRGCELAVSPLGLPVPPQGWYADRVGDEGTGLLGIRSTVLALDVSPLASTLTAPSGAQTDAPAAAPTPEGAQRYERLGILGEGGMGRVERVRDRDLLREVALKHLQPLLASDAHMLAQFLWEARVTAHLDHPHIVPVHDVGQSDEGLFFTMKLVRGRALSGALAEAREHRGSFGLPRRLRAFHKLAEAVSFAHSRGVLHRDLKPDNVMIGEYGEVLVTDWGIALPVGEAGAALARFAPTTLARASVGTPLYMSPEQTRGDVLDERSDVYALGAILYELVALAPAFAADTLPELLGKIARGDVAPLTKVVPGISRSLAAVVRKAMALDAADRYPSASALAEDVETVLDGRTPEADKASVVRRLARYYVAHDPGMARLRVVDVDLWMVASACLGAATALLFAVWLAAYWWAFAGLGVVVAVPTTLRWLRLRRRR